MKMMMRRLLVRGRLEVAAPETLNPRTKSGRFASDHLPVRVLVRLQAAKSAPAE